MKEYLTEQEDFWAGEFGNEYTERNKGKKQLAASITLFSSMLSKMGPVNTVLEIGPNRGINLLALQQLLPDAELSGVEINQTAVDILNSLNFIKVYHQSILDFKADYPRDLVFSRGVLIHINPDMLDKVYETMYLSSNRYICIAEYYNPTPVEISYRGISGKLFKRDFAGDMLDKYKDLELIDYGFCYHRDNNFPHDDITWFIMEKGINR